MRAIPVHFSTLMSGSILPSAPIIWRQEQPSLMTRFADSKWLGLNSGLKTGIEVNPDRPGGRWPWLRG